MYISTEIASIFPVPILYTPIQKINLVIIIMHMYIIIINVLFLLLKKIAINYF